ncbi:hypothetical protein J4731_14010 [Providencia rettgeri]|nr:hypothetical protein [Providencia rettgeri]
MDTSLLYAVIGALSGVLVGGLATWFSIAQKLRKRSGTTTTQSPTCCK